MIEAAPHNQCIASSDEPSEAAEDNRLPLFAYVVGFDGPEEENLRGTLNGIRQKLCLNFSRHGKRLTADDDPCPACREHNQGLIDSTDIVILKLAERLSTNVLHAIRGALLSKKTVIVYLKPGVNPGEEVLDLIRNIPLRRVVAGEKDLVRTVKAQRDLHLSRP